MIDSYVEKLQNKSERQLQTMLNSIEKETAKIEAEKNRLENKLKEKIKKGHLIKDALIEKWRTPSPELLEAIKEVKNGQTTKYNSVDEMMKDLRQ